MPSTNILVIPQFGPDSGLSLPPFFISLDVKMLLSVVSDTFERHRIALYPSSLGFSDQFLYAYVCFPLSDNTSIFVPVRILMPFSNNFECDTRYLISITSQPLPSDFRDLRSPLNFTMPTTPYPFTIMLPTPDEHYPNGNSFTRLTPTANISHERLDSPTNHTPIVDVTGSANDYLFLSTSNLLYLDLIHRPLPAGDDEISLSSLPRPLLVLNTSRHDADTILTSRISTFNDSQVLTTLLLDLTIEDEVLRMSLTAHNGLTERIGLLRDPGLNGTMTPGFFGSGFTNLASTTSNNVTDDNDTLVPPSPSTQSMPIEQSTLIVPNLNANNMLNEIMSSLASSARIHFFASSAICLSDQDSDIMFSELLDLLQILSRVDHEFNTPMIFARLSPEINTCALEYANFFATHPTHRHTTTFLSPPLTNASSDDDTITFVLSRVFALHQPSQILTFLSGHAHPCSIGMLCPLNFFSHTHGSLSFTEYMFALNQCSSPTLRRSNRGPLVPLRRSSSISIQQDASTQTDPCDSEHLPTSVEPPPLNENECYVLYLVLSDQSLVIRLIREEQSSSVSLYLIVEVNPSGRSARIPIRFHTFVFMMLVLSSFSVFLLSYT
jgi:hypothetical protein